MKYSRFEDLPVWQAAIEFAIKIFEFTNVADFRGVGDVKKSTRTRYRFHLKQHCRRLRARHDCRTDKFSIHLARLGWRKSFDVVFMRKIAAL
jgi:Na+/phosphate symporter